MDVCTHREKPVRFFLRSGEVAVVEQDVIGHLMDVERLACDLLLDAQTEADKRKIAAKEQAEKNFLAQYEQSLAVFEEKFLQDRTACETQREQELAQFDALLSDISPDRVSFNTYLEHYFFGS